MLRAATVDRRMFVLGALASVLTAAHAQLKPGAPAPVFTLQAALGGREFRFDLSQTLAKGPVVLYFYPKAFTAGCTYEAQLFAQASERFAALGATVIGVSSDDIDTLKRFSVEACRHRFAVGADPDGRIIRAYKAQIASRPDVADRISYVISPEGRILHVHHHANPEGHVDSTLEAVERWKARQQVR